MTPMTLHQGGIEAFEDLAALLPLSWHTVPGVTVEAAREYELKGYWKRAEREGAAFWTVRQSGKAAGALLAESLAFDTGIFGIPMGRFVLLLPGKPDTETLGTGKALLREGLEWARQQGIRHTSIRTFGQEQAAVIAVEAEGFRLMSTHLTLMLTCRTPASPPPEGVILRDGRPEDIEICQRLAYRTSYPLSRFNLDPAFTPEALATFYGTWTRNSFNGRAKWFMVLDDEEEGVIGYSFWDEGPDFTESCGLKIIDHTLSGIPPTLRRRGLFQSFITKGLERGLEHGYRYQTGVISINNIACLRSYMKLGCAILGSHHDLHRMK